MICASCAFVFVCVMCDFDLWFVRKFLNRELTERVIAAGFE